MATNVVQLVDNLALSSSTSTTGYSPSVTMTGANAVQLTVLMAVNSATGLTPSLEGSNDLSNWSSITSWSQITTVGYSAPAAATSIAFQYVRVKFVLATTGTIIFSANLATAQL